MSYRICFQKKGKVECKYSLKLGKVLCAHLWELPIRGRTDWSEQFLGPEDHEAQLRSFGGPGLP